MFDAIARSLLLPQVGDSAPRGSLQLGMDKRLFDVSQAGSRGGLFTLDASTARFVDPNYDTGALAGGSWDYLHWLQHAGFDVEKDFASSALTDGRPTLAVIQRDTYLDGRHLFINFQTDLGKALGRLLGGVLAADWDTVAPYVPSTTAPPEILHLADENPTRPRGSFLLFPNLGYLQQLGSVIRTQLYSRLGTDLTLQNKLLMYLEGTEGVIDLPDAQKVKFTDPRSDFTYVARLYGPDTVDGKTTDSGIASRMLAHANKLLTLAYEVELGAGRQLSMSSRESPLMARFVLGASDSMDNPTTTKGFEDYVGVLDVNVEIARRISHGAGCRSGRRQADSEGVHLFLDPPARSVRAALPNTASGCARSSRCSSWRAGCSRSRLRRPPPRPARLISSNRWTPPRHRPSEVEMPWRRCVKTSTNWFRSALRSKRPSRRRRRPSISTGAPRRRRSRR